ncbi:MAG: multiheme c-type cytochrome [Sandaracinus sp.]
MSERRLRALGRWKVAILAAVVACGRAEAEPELGASEVQSPAPAPVVTTPSSEPSAITVRLPRDEGPFYPSQLRMAEGEAVPVDGERLERLADDASCETCHPSAASQHHAGPHGNASFGNPWYRSVIERLREDETFRESRHCAGCHDPLLLVSGRMDREIDPADPLTRAGVTCNVCHGITAATSDGNASYVLSTADPLIPDPNVPEEVERHRERMAPAVLRTPLLCGSCHRGFLGPEETHSGAFLSGIDELGAWRGSAWGGQRAQRIEPTEVEARECRSCHMDPEPAEAGEFAATEGQIASHRFAGGHVPIARHDEAQRARVEARMRTAATLDVAGFTRADGSFVPLAEGDELPVGERVVLELVIRNVGVGHRFPGGARDIRDHFVTLEVHDASGRSLGRAGDRYAQGDASDPTAYALRTAVLDEDGQPDVEHLVHRFRALGWDHTIAPRDAALVRYAVTIPADAQRPVRVEALLRARRHPLPFSRFACASSRTRRGRTFDARAHEAGLPPLDACADEPIVDVARFDSREIVGPLWQRLYEHALASSHDVQEALGVAEHSAHLALEQAPETPEIRAAILVLEADVLARTGRRDEALATADRAEALVGVHPAIDRARGHAEAQVWRWREAAEAFGRVASAAPLDTEAQRDHARALGSMARGPETLSATALGLRLFPRDEQLLRSQSLALGDLEADALASAHVDEGTLERARAAFVRYRRPDDETQLRLACEQEARGCAADRLPVRVISLR